MGIWNDIYVAALLEGDPDKAPFVIQEAEEAIIEGARELFKVSANVIEEEKALNDALCALGERKACLAVHGRFAEAAGHVTDSEKQ
jgi:hypothetical protein